MEERSAKRPRLVSPENDSADVAATSRLVALLDPDKYYPMYASLMRALDTHITAFRAELGRCEALIFGKFVLQFFKRNFFFDDTYLDIVVEDGKNAESLQRHLIEKEGCGLGTGKVRIPMRLEYVAKCTVFSRGIHHVRLITTRILPLQAVLTGRNDTLQINFISWNKAYSIFPRITFLDLKTVQLQEFDKNTGRRLKFYSRYGWKVQTEPVTARELSGPTSRRVGDRYTWMMPLDTWMVWQPHTPVSVLEYSGFDITKPEEYLGTHYNTWAEFERSLKYTIRAKLFTSNVLRYRYTSGPLLKLGPALERNTLLQLCKLDTKTRNQLIGADVPAQISAYRLQFKHPEGWDYLDVEIPRMLEKLDVDEEDEEDEEDE
ncbi:hypothetical protein BJ170DRAFT_722824 [Xylariales sp. AK1849]|nr:hypothetical protein BJ170DRAFT_722824 [Xylariales sp. AK1849]